MATMTFTLKDYLVKIKRLALIADVPTDVELAQACGMKPTPFSRMVNNRTDGISRQKVALIVAELRRRGLRPSFDDLFEYNE
jgi:histidinol phosphatase-like enzyme